MNNTVTVNEKVHRLVAATFILVAVILLTGPPAIAGGSVAPTQKHATGEFEGLHNGAYTTSIPISVPGYHGIEPRVSLRYSSSAQNGFVGVGWRLRAASTIERVSPGRGAPAFDSSDIYFLDGQALLVDTSLGGTHSTIRQRYLRVEKDQPSAGRWRVTGRNGARFVYSPITIASWGLTTAADPHGNVVTYNWTTGTGGACEATVTHCYLDNITYNGTVIVFYREPRPDVLKFATGSSTLGVIDKRLLTIDVTVGTARAAAWTLSYTASGSTSQSLLASVQRYGTDATLDGAGNVTGGTAAPKEGFGYSVEGDGTFAGLVRGVISSGNYAPHELHYTDVSGDGKADFCAPWKSTSGWYSYCALSNGDGTFAGLVRDVIATVNYAPHEFHYADVNGDGKADFCAPYKSTSGLYSYCALSNGDGTFARQVIDVLSTGNFAPHALYYVDIDGDGKADLCAPYKSTSGWYSYCALSNGDGTFAGLVRDVIATVNYAPHEFHYADVNGDGKMDFCAPYRGTLGLYSYCALSNGDGTFAGQQIDHIGTGDWTSYRIKYVDVNGDGAQDFTAEHAGQTGWVVYVALSNGDGTFSEKVRDDIGTGNWSSYKLGAASLRSADVNGDGMADAVARNLSTGGLVTYVALSNGDGTFAEKVRDDLATGNYAPHEAHYADVDGDGKTDFCAPYKSRSGLYSYCAMANGEAPSLLTSATNGLGGTTTMTYAPSSSYPNTYLPVGGIYQTVSSVTLDDGRTGDPNVVTHYDYSGAKVDDTERRFLGFRTVRATDASGAYTETTYTQNVADPIATIEQVDRRDTSDQLFSSTTNIFGRDGNGITTPYLSWKAEAWSYACNGDATCKVSMVASSAPDSYGNVDTVTQWGDVTGDTCSPSCTPSGDEITIITQFANNVTDYLVGAPRRRVICEGDLDCDDAGAGQHLLEERFYWDNQAYGVAPTLGNGTKNEKWLATKSRWVASTAAYDSYGNRISTTDPLGNTTTQSFDAAYHTFVTQSCEPRTGIQTHCTNMSNLDAQCGLHTMVTNENDLSVTTTMDALCRAKRLDYPDSSYKKTDYCTLPAADPNTCGDTTEQHIRTAIKDGSGDDLWEKTYFDGLDRTYKTTSEPDQSVYTVYDNIGRVEKTSTSHSTTECPDEDGVDCKWTSVTYDPSGRTLKTVAADGSETENVYGDWSVTRYDALDNKIEHHFDAFGRLMTLTEHNGTSTYTTHTDYDGLGRFLTITDDLLNVTSFVYDSLGRRTSVFDPDLGTWSYDYDDAGRLTSQTDAKHQTLTMSYDEMGRATQKSYGATVLANFTYDEALPGYYNVGHLTSVDDGDQGKASSTFDYDTMGRATDEIRSIDGETFTVERRYDSAGRLRSLTYPDAGAEVLTHSYDAAGRLSSMGSYVTATSYDARGNMTSRTLGNGVIETYNYDTNRFWLDSVQIDKGATFIEDVTYGHDLNGRLISVDSSMDSDLGVIYSYDDLGRLTGRDSEINAEDETFTYDAIGRIISQDGIDGPMSYDYTDSPVLHAPNNVSGGTFGDVSYHYDLNGNRTSGTASLTYDVQNRLTNDGSTAYIYDAQGERVIASVAMFFYNEKRLDKLYHKDGSSETLFYADVAQRVDGTLSYVHRLPGGFTRMTNSSGLAVSLARYSSFGRELNAPDVSTPRGHQGELFESSGLYSQGRRFRDPVLGQWTQPDTMYDRGGSQGLNRYAYVLNDPIGRTDPTGLLSDGKDVGELLQEHFGFGPFGDSTSGRIGKLGSTIANGKTLGRFALNNLIVEARLDLEEGYGIEDINPVLIDAIAVRAALLDEPLPALLGFGLPGERERAETIDDATRFGLDVLGIDDPKKAYDRAKAIADHDDTGTTPSGFSHRDGAIDVFSRGPFDLEGPQAGESDPSASGQDAPGPGVSTGDPPGKGIGDVGGFGPDGGKPVVLDLDNDGVELTGLAESTAFFDFDDDGFLENTAWVSPDDGILVIDLASDGAAGADGVISRADEIAFTEWDDNATTDLEGLALAFDNNGDSVLDEQDERFDEFRVWQDLDANGSVEDGELKTLEQAGINSINLTSDNQRSELPDGSVIHGHTSYRTSDGHVREVADVEFQYNPAGVAYEKTEEGTHSRLR